MRTLTRHEKILLLIALIVGIVFSLRSFLPWHENIQFTNLQKIEAHIKSIQPKWKEFKANNPGYEDVTLTAYTGGDGMFGAFGKVPTDAHAAKLKNFLVRTQPPRP